MKQKIKFILTAIAVFSIMLGCQDSDVNEPDKDKTNEITIGVLVSLTGNWSSLGVTTKAALENAVTGINKKFTDDGSKLKFTLKIIDTKLDPETAYAAAQELITNGVQIIIGPQSSAELIRIKPLLNENNIFAVSMSSTAGSLALNGDHVLRFCPDDKPEGLAISRLMWERNIRKVVAVYRDDEGNIGLKRSMTNSYSGTGGIVIDSIKYSNDDNITSTLIEQISASVKRGNNSAETAVYLAGFDEVAEIFALAAADETLSSVLWFGSNGSAMSAMLIENTAAARFANNVEFCSPLFALSNETETEWSPVSAAIEQSTGLKPEAYTFAAYDALQVAALAYKTLGDTYPFSALLTAYIQVAGEHQGLTGLTELNDAGDRKYGNFTLLGICGTEPNFSWAPVGSYNTATSILIYEGCN